jgi:beta propeller repeat protein
MQNRVWMVAAPLSFLNNHAPAQVVTLIAALVTCAHAWGDVPGTITRLSTGSRTDTQNAPAISGNTVVWADFNNPVGGTSNFDIFVDDITGTPRVAPAPPINASATPPFDQDFVADVDGRSVIWIHTTIGRPGDVILYDTLLHKQVTIASSSRGLHYEQPAIHNQYATALRVGAQIDVDLFDVVQGLPLGPITNDALVQARPRVGDDAVVFEQYPTSDNSDIYGYQISTGNLFPIATTANNEFSPDIDGSTVVWVQHANNTDQIFTYDLKTTITRQLTQAASNKSQPRVSGSRVVWTDDRFGTLDLFLYDLRTSTEQPLVIGVGDQYTADISGSNVVYTSNEAGFEQVYLFSIGTAR